MDVLCRKCGEPWDSYGIFHGDVAAWEADMIIKGAGCPSCEGRAISHERTFMQEDEHNVALEGNDPFDPDNVIEYKEPDPKVIWTCTKCGHNWCMQQCDIIYDGRGNRVYTFEPDQSSHEMLEKKGDHRPICQSCHEKSNVCEGCGLRFFDEEDTIYVQDLNETYCEDCYSDNIISCEQCGCSMKMDDSHGFEDESLCEWCYNNVKKTCESCGEVFHKNNLILGPNEEDCCSEDCADDLVEDESELLLED